MILENYGISLTKSEVIHKKIRKLIALDNQPFTITWYSHLQSRYLLPSRRHLSETIITNSSNSFWRIIWKIIQILGGNFKLQTNS